MFKINVITSCNVKDIMRMIIALLLILLLCFPGLLMRELKLVYDYKLHLADVGNNSDKYTYNLDYLRSFSSQHQLDN